jgi:hypothetical protein
LAYCPLWTWRMYVLPKRCRNFGRTLLHHRVCQSNMRALPAKVSRTRNPMLVVSNKQNRVGVPKARGPTVTLPWVTRNSQRQITAKFLSTASMKELNPDNSVADLIIQPSIKRFTLIRHSFVQRLNTSYCSNSKHKGCQFLCSFDKCVIHIQRPSRKGNF